MRVITFSKVFPKHHPMSGEETNFVGKILMGEKVHTIRAGHRWKVGDMFSPRIWSDKPYRSKQIKFHPPIEIKKIWNFQVSGGNYILNGDKDCDWLEIAKNDGLDNDDFEYWFMTGKPFDGQILCWSENINY